MRKRKFQISAVPIFCVAAFSMGQLFADSLNGIITDPSGGTVAGASIELRRAGKKLAGTRTDTAGHFSITADSGHYELWITSAGFAETRREIELRVVEQTLTLQLTVAVFRREMTVSGDIATLESQSTGTKLDLNNTEAPLAIETVSRETIRSRAIVDLDQTVETVAGIQRAPGFPFQTGYFIRGFFDTYDILHDGFRDYTGSEDIAAIDHVEVLKGAPGPDYGTLASGGILNVVTKSPFNTRHATAEFMAGSYDFYRGAIDANAPFFHGKLLARIDIAYRNAGSFRDYLHDNNVFVAPAVSWRPSVRDTVTLKGEWNHLDIIFPSDLPYYAVFTQVPVGFSISEPNFGGSRNNIFREQIEYRHEFSKDWQFREGFNATNQFLHIGQERVYNTTLEPNGVTLDRTVSSGPQNSLNYTWQQELYGRVQNFGISHQFAFGIEAYRERYNYINNFASLAPLDILHPVYNARPGAISPGLDGSYGGDNIGGYAQDYIGFGRSWHLLAAGRFDGNDTLSIDYLGASRSDAHAHKFSPRLALSYQPAKDTTVYFDWSRSFLPNFGASVTGKAFQPVIGEQFEAGAKRTLFSQHLLATVAFYRLTKQNVLTGDPQSPQFSIATGEQRSQGIEATVSGQAGHRVLVTAAYAYTLASVTKDSALPLGSALPNVPRNQISIWAVYQLPFEQLRGVSIGIGEFYAGRRQATLRNSFLLNSYNRFDASVAYSRERWRFSVTCKNLTSVRYYDADGGYAIRPNAPLTVIGTVRRDF